MVVPVSFSQLTWSKPVLVQDLVARKPGALQPPDLPGLYVFTRGNKAFSAANENVLYVGKGDRGQSSIKTRTSCYLNRFRKGNTRPGKFHQGCEALYDLYKVKPADMYLRWAVVSIASQIEGWYHEIFDPPCNFRFEETILAFDEYIPDEYLR